MDVWSTDKLFLFLIFFLPGFISIKVYDLLVPGEARDFSKSLLEAVAYSTLNFAVLSVPFLYTVQFYGRSPVLSAAVLATIMVVVPALWPVLFYRVLSSGRPFARYFRHPIRKPWDYVFGKRQPFWVVVHLQDGRKIGGRFGFGSFASSSPAEEQIYIEEVWSLDEHGAFLNPIDQSAGIIIMQSQIALVEFFYKQ